MLPACAQYVHRIDHFETIRWALPSCANAREDKVHKSQDAHSFFPVCVYFAGADDSFKLIRIISCRRCSPLPCTEDRTEQELNQ